MRKAEKFRLGSEYICIISPFSQFYRKPREVRFSKNAVRKDFSAWTVNREKSRSEKDS